MKRLLYLDETRGLAILAVVLGHAIQYSANNFDDQLLFRLIYAVHMPLFMFISGFVTKLPATGWSNRFAWVRSRVQQLLFPFLTWIPISFLAITFLQRPSGFSVNFFIFVQDLARSPDSGGLWFLLVLFECQLLLMLASVAGLHRVGWISMTLLFLLNLLIMTCPATNWFGLGLLRWYFLFFLVGFVASLSSWKPPTPCALISWLLIYLLLAAFWYRKSAVPVDLWLAQASVGVQKIAVQGYHAITAFAAIGTILGIFSTLKKYNLFASLRYCLVSLSSVSLEIYAGHYIFLYAAINQSSTWQTYIWVRIIYVALSALGGAIILQRLVSRLPILHRLLYGC